MSATAKPLMYSRQGAAGMLGFSLSKVEDLIASGQLRSVKVGKRRMITTAHLEAFVAQLEAEAEQDRESTDA